MAKLSVLIFIHLVTVILAEDDWTKQCNRCKCIWTSGRKSADCTSNKFVEIPRDLSIEIREIDFSNNQLIEFRKNEFKDANLRDIHKLKFQNCSVQEFDDLAFSGLVLLIELDLSRNEIVKLNRDIFRENVKLRVISFSFNKIKVVEEGLFYNMSYVQKISLDHNEIEHLGNASFQKLPVLNHIGLEYNRLKSLSLDFDSLPRLSSLTIADNPWICDCNLEAFKKHVLVNNLNTAPVMCNAPKLYKDQVWSNELIFACVPKIWEPTANTIIKIEDANVTLACKVSGDPTPDVDWVTNGRIIERDPHHHSKQKYIISKNNIGDYWYNNLTIVNFSYRDRGDYKCLAKNPGGEQEVNITLTYPPHMVSGNAPIGINLGLIIGLSVVICVTLIIIIVTLVCFCKRNSHNAANQKRNDDSDGAEEFIGLRNQPEVKKQQLTDVNPVLKPPRVTIPGSVTSGGTEVSDHRRILQDTDSVYDVDEESCSMDGSTMPLMRKSQLLFEEYRPYPPDLLPFPPRALQPSPAGSSASTVADTTRLPPHHGPQSPLHSPIYDQLYRTLPHSRSQSPYVAQVPPRIPRLGQGYVTIPRRPRQSWSSEPPLSDIGEPLYDNLGIRTSVNGSSALSLNKLGGDTSTPKSNRLVPQGTSIGPIAENEPPPVAQTLPRNLSKLSPSRTNWAKANAEALRSPEKRKSTTSLPGTDGKKIPPRPPPKPKKQVASRPLFEDEGEDGTEV